MKSFFEFCFLVIALAMILILVYLMGRQDGYQMGVEQKPVTTIVVVEHWRLGKII